MPTRARTVGAVGSGATARPRLPAWAVSCLLLLLTVALYWPATRAQFVNYDDDFHVTANLQVQKGLTWENIKWGALNPVNCIWYPITVWSHMADCQLFGLNPWGHHLTSVLLHAINTVLIFLLLRGLTGALWPSFLVAALFGWHPVHVESVAWVAERKDLTSGFFGLLALMAYARYARGRMQNAECRTQKSVAARALHAPRSPLHVSRFTFHPFYALSLLFFALGLMSKPVLVTWPFVMLLLDCWPFRRVDLSTPNSQLSTILRLVLEKVPFLVLTAAASVLTFVVQRHSGALTAGETLPLGARVGNALVSYCRYLRNVFWPADLAVIYPHPGLWPLWEVVLAGAFVLGFSLLLWVGRKRYAALLVGWLFYCGTLVPMIQIIQTGSHAMADRYMYIPLLGALILTVWGAYELSRGWRFQVQAMSLLSAVAIFSCLALTRQQIGYWKNSEVLFRHALDVTKNNDGAHNGLGIALDQKGQLAEAIAQFQEAIRLKPLYASAHCNLGIALDKSGQVDEAIRQFEEAIRLKPDQAGAHYGLGVVLSKKGQLDEAVRQLKEAIRLKPDYAEARNDLGIALGRTGQMAEAIQCFQEAVRLNPGSAEAQFNLGLVLGMKGRTAEAVPHLEAALKARPNYPEAHNYLGSALYQQGRIGEAIAQFQEALRLNPGYAEARKNLDNALANQPPASEPPGAAPKR